MYTMKCSIRLQIRVGIKSLWLHKPVSTFALLSAVLPALVSMTNAFYFYQSTACSEFTYICICMHHRVTARRSRKITFL